MVFYPAIFREIRKVISLFRSFFLEEFYPGWHFKLCDARWTHMKDYLK